MLPKEWDDHSQQVRATSHHVTVNVFSVIVMTDVRDHGTDPEEVSEIGKAPKALLALGYREFVKHLIAGLVASSTRAAWLSHDAD